MTLKRGKLIDYEDIPPHLKNEAQDIVENVLLLSQASSRPRLVHLCGMPGAGKSTYAASFVKDHAGYNLVQFDTVMEQLCGYRRDCAATNLPDAFKSWEWPARAIGYYLLQTLLENKRDILFDHSATARSHLDLIDRVK